MLLCATDPWCFLGWLLRAPLQIVFKALIVLHTMIRNGATDNILAYLSSSDVLKLRNVSSGNWEGEPRHNPRVNHPLNFDPRI